MFYKESLFCIGYLSKFKTESFISLMKDIKLKNINEIYQQENSTKKCLFC